MSLPYVGRGGIIGLAAESTYGTAVSRTNWLPLLPGSFISKTMNRQPRQSLYTGARAPQGFFLEGSTVRGTLNFEATYENFGLVLKHVLGALNTSGTGPYDHDYSLGAVAALSLTGELIRGSAPNSEIYEGLQVSRATLSASAGQLLQLRVDVVGETSQTPASAGTPSLGSGHSPIHGTQAGTISYNSNTFEPIDFELTISNNLVYPRRVMGSDVSKQAAARFSNVTLKVTREYDSETQYSEFVTGATSQLLWSFTGSGNNVMRLTLHGAYATAESPRRLANDGPLTQEITYVSDNDGSGTYNGCTIRLTNDNASGVAN